MLHDNGGAPTGYLFAARNITERKRIENSEREQRIFAEALQDVAIALNSTLDQDAMWDKILVNLDRVVPADSSAILLVEGAEARVVGRRTMLSMHAAITFEINALTSVLSNSCSICCARKNRTSSPTPMHGPKIRLKT